jgi:hypothetical protein
MDEIERKLRELQVKVDEIEKRPETVEAYSGRSPDSAVRIHDEGYPYLPRPQIEILPTGKIKISFAAEWTSLEKENFLKDMKARAVKKDSRADDK